MSTSWTNQEEWFLLYLLDKKNDYTYPELEELFARRKEEQGVAGGFPTTRSAEAIRKKVRREGWDEGDLEEEFEARTEEDFVDPEEAKGKAKYNAKFDAENQSMEVEARVKTLQDLIEVAQIDLSDWKVGRWRANAWEGMAKVKGPDGEERLTTKTLHQVKANLERRFVDTPGLGEVPAFEAPERVEDTSHIQCAVILPDSQHGFRWREAHTKLEPIHDRTAIDAALGLVNELNPDQVVYLGDMLDLAPWSGTFPRPVNLRDTTTPSIRELYWQLLQFRQAAPHARHIYFEGNHEYRIARTLVEKVPEASATIAMGEEESPFSIPRLLALDQLDIEYSGPYKDHGPEAWIFPDLRIEHGESTAPAHRRAKNITHSVIYGHTHRAEISFRRCETADGWKIFTVGSPGCLCRVDGAVPAKTSRVNWQQGVMVVWHDTKRKISHVELVPILDGILIYRGSVFVGEDRRVEIADFAGYPQIAR